jgi:hypothetical protein
MIRPNLDSASSPGRISPISDKVDGTAVMILESKRARYEATTSVSGWLSVKLLTLEMDSHRKRRAAGRNRTIELAH